MNDLIRILIVDDSALVRARLAMMMDEVKNAEIVGQAGSSLEAIIGVRNLAPDVVILDLRMPGGGMSVLEYIKRKSFSTKVIILTNYATDHARLSCLNAGAEYFFDKSKEFENVITILEAMTPNIIIQARKDSGQ